MLRTIKMVDQLVPLWEIIVILLAILAIVLVLVLWWAYGYNLVVVMQQPLTMTGSSMGASLLGI